MTTEPQDERPSESVDLNAPPVVPEPEPPTLLLDEPGAAQAATPSAEALLETGESLLAARAAEAAKIAAQQHLSAQLDELGAKLRTLTPGGRARFVARMGDAHAAIRLMNELLARGE